MKIHTKAEAIAQAKRGGAMMTAEEKREKRRLLRFLEEQARTNDAFARDSVPGSDMQKQFRVMAEGNRRAVARLKLELETPKGKTQ